MIGGNATHVAGEKLGKLLTWAAADLLKCAPAQIVRDGETYIGPSEEPKSFEQVVQHARDLGLTLSVQGTWRMPSFTWNFETGQGTPYYCYTFGAMVTEVEVDLASGETHVTGAWAAHDGGKIIFPQGAMGQMSGGFAQAMGYGLLEEFTFQNGYPSATSYDNYMIPTAVDVPDVEGTFIEVPYPEGPFGARNLAEPMILAAAPAIANALFQATGRRTRKMPLSLEQVLLGYDLQAPGSEERCRKALENI
jgi:CO/xanthine dehydrogenase Mo-binding subunit